MELVKMGVAVLLCMALIGDVAISAAVWKSSCQQPRIGNGRLLKTARKASSGHMFKYRCRKGYRRLGNMFNICLRGSWVLDHAVCTKRGCPLLSSPPGGSARQSILGDVTSFQCRSGLRLNGSSTLYCNGRRWNGTVPLCQGPGTRLWTADEVDGGGPARLFSARLPAAASASGCYRFWHRRRRRRRRPAGVDPIRVYALVDDPAAPQGLLRIALQGTDGRRRRQWRERIVPLPPLETDFQVVIEADQPTGRETDVALGDVTLMHGDECGAVSASPPPPRSAGANRGTSSTRGRARKRIRIVRPSLSAASQEEENQPTTVPVSPRLPSHGDQPPSSDSDSDSSSTVTGSSPRVTAAPSDADGRLESISPRQGSVNWSRRPGDAERTLAKHPSLTALPFPISPTTPRQRGHGAAAERGSTTGFSSLPVEEKRLMQRGDGDEDGVMLPAEGDGGVPPMKGDEGRGMSPVEGDGDGAMFRMEGDGGVPPMKGDEGRGMSPVEGDGDGAMSRMEGDGNGLTSLLEGDETVPVAVEDREVSSVPVMDSGHPEGHSDGGLVGDGGVSGGDEDITFGSNGGEGIATGARARDHGEGGCEGDGDCGRGGVFVRKGGLKTYQSSRPSGIESEDVDIDSGIDMEGDDTVTLPEKMDYSPMATHEETTTFVNVRDDSSTSHGNPTLLGTKQPDSPSYETMPSDLPTPLAPRQRSPAYTVRPRDLPTSASPRNLPNEKDETDSIIFPDMVSTTRASYVHQNAVDDGKSGAILFQGPPSSSGLPLYVIVASAAGGCVVLLSTLTLVVVLRRRRRTDAAIVAPDSVFEPEPSDRGPIAELMRQNRRDHQPVVPDPVSL